MTSNLQLKNMETKKFKGGTSCAVATCGNYSSKLRNLGNTDISFYRFPKEPGLQKQWALKCKRDDKWNPSTSSICSYHFNADDFIRDLKSELLGYTPNVKKLKPGAIPSFNMPDTRSPLSMSTINRRKRTEVKSAKEVHNQIVTNCIEKSLFHQTTLAFTSSEESTDTQNISLLPVTTPSPDYEKLYKELLQEHNKLKNELLITKQVDLNYKTINESLRCNMKILQKNCNSTNMLLKKTQTKMYKEIKTITLAKDRAIETKAKQCLSSFLSTNQLDILMKKKKRVNWTRDEISTAFTLRYLSKRAYVYVKDELHYPLPGISSLQRWAKTIEMRNGVLHDVLKIMKINAQNLEPYERLTVLMFDEMKVTHTLEYDVLHDQVMGPHDQMQIIMARGIAAPWKQPVMVDFDKRMTKSILFDVIEQLDMIGYKVICCVCDCGGGNMGLWKELGINYEKPLFAFHGERDVVCVPDSPHLLKLVRNWLLDTGFQLNDKVITKEPLEALVTMMSSELNVCHKISKEHITCEGPQRQKVKLATQLLSHTTSIALQHYKPIQNLKLNNDTAEFIELINNWFDLTNVSHPNNNHTPFKAPYGKYLEEQQLLLEKVYDTISSMRCIGKHSLQVFQKGILMHINGTRYLLNILKELGLQYLLTSKINQDALENLFSQFRSRGGLNDHPSPLNALYRLRMILLGKNPGISSYSNTKDKNNEDFLILNVFKEADIDICINNVNNDVENRTSDTDTTSDGESLDKSFVQDEKNMNEMTIDAIEYLTGWVAKKFRFKYPELGSTTTELNTSRIPSNHGHDYTLPSWINHLSYGGLIVPSSNFKKIISRSERLFRKFTKNEIPKGTNVVNQLTNKIYNRLVTDDKYKIVIKTYVKQRLLIRMKYLNQNMISMNKIRKSRLRLQRLNKLRKTIT